MIDMTVSPAALEILRKLKNSRIISMSSPNVMSSEFATKVLTIATDGKIVNILLDLEEHNFEGFEEDYCHFDAIEVNAVSNKAIRKGNLYFEAQGQLIQDIWIARDRISNFHESVMLFSLEADSAIVLRLENTWVSFTHVFTAFDAIDINFAETKEQLCIRDPSDNWENDLVDVYQFEREWIKL